eukprot:303407-Pyramimonas_sp.AAC.1
MLRSASLASRRLGSVCYQSSAQGGDVYLRRAVGRLRSCEAHCSAGNDQEYSPTVSRRLRSICYQSCD